jgi:hypothetical protein
MRGLGWTKDADTRVPSAARTTDPEFHEKSTKIAHGSPEPSEPTGQLIDHPHGLGTARDMIESPAPPNQEKKQNKNNPEGRTRADARRSSYGVMVRR